MGIIIVKGEAQIKNALRSGQLTWVGGSGGSIKCLGILGPAEGGQANWTSNALKGATEVLLQTESKDWSECEVTAGTTKETATPTCPHLAIKQPGKGELKATGTSLVECLVKTSNCLSGLPSQTLGNATLENSGSNQNDWGEIGPLKATAKGLCSLVLGSSTTESKLLLTKAEPLVLHAIKLI